MKELKPEEKAEAEAKLAEEKAEADVKEKAEPEEILVEVILDGYVWYNDEEFAIGESLKLPEAEAARLKRKKVAHYPDDSVQPAPKKRR